MVRTVRTVRGRIQDKDGDFTDHFTTIAINNVNPIVNADPPPINENQFATLTGDFTEAFPTRIL